MPESVRYHLNKFPPADLEWKSLIPLIVKANASLARYDGLLSAIPNASVLLSPLTTQEAILSSKIESTHVTMGEVLELEAGGKPGGITQPKRDDAEEILNYRHAMKACVSTLLLKVCNKKQENQAAIFIKSSVDAAKNAFTMFVNRTPLKVT